MTKGHEQSPAVALPGLRAERAAGREVHHTQAGRIAVPLTLLRGGRPVEDLALVLTAEEAAAFYLELGKVLYPSPSAEEAAS
ncbi:hypothetical protein [Streptomyces sp. NPDC059928]|uniref:hypothetical protein n=1 Tax=unclassified Streptomyces TaxID=2593676 RepID=UPI00364FC4E1